MIIFTSPPGVLLEALTWEEEARITKTPKQNKESTRFIDLPPHQSF
jgi:hypothetical protein